MSENDKYLFDQAYHFIKNSPMEKHLKKAGRIDRTWALYLVFCQCCGVADTAKSYQAYRVACMAAVALFLPKDRPSANPTTAETQRSLFDEPGTI